MLFLGFMSQLAHYIVAELAYILASSKLCFVARSRLRQQVFHCHKATNTTNELLCPDVAKLVVWFTGLLKIYRLYRYNALVRTGENLRYSESRVLTGANLFTPLYAQIDPSRTDWLNAMKHVTTKTVLEHRIALK